MAVLSPTDIWIIGNGSLHWNGTKLSPSIGPGSTSINAVASTQGRDIWTFGGSQNSSSDNLWASNSSTEIDHWNGLQWSTENNSADGILIAGAIIGPNDVWGVGGTTPTMLADGGTLAEHWTGSTWDVAETPNLGPDSFNGVAGTTSHDVWAVGATGSDTHTSMVAHWNGSTWSLVASAHPGQSQDLYAAVAVSGQSDWAVGDYIDGNQERRALIEHYPGCSS